MKCSACHEKIFKSRGRTFIFLALNSGDVKCSSCEEEINQASKDGQTLSPLLKVPLSNLNEHETGFLNREIRLHKDSIQVKAQEKVKEWDRECAICKKNVKTGAMYLLAQKCYKR